VEKRVCLDKPTKGFLMKLISNDQRLNYKFDPALNFGFEKHTVDLGFTLVMSITKPEAIRGLNGRAIYFDLEEPNRFFVKDWNPDLNREWDRYLTIDPFSNQFFNATESRAGESVFIPTDPDKVPPISQKRKYDLVYTGHLVSADLIKMLTGLSRKFNLAVVSNSDHPLVTHRGLNYEEKLEVISNSRAALIHNVLWPSSNDIKTLKGKVPLWREHGAFSHLNHRSLFDTPVVPQLKSRLFEAAFCGAAPLILRDDWRLAERFFPSRLAPTIGAKNVTQDISEILESARELTAIGLEARQLAFQEFTTRHFIEKFLVPFAS
jgi:hypothetical protein